MPEGRKKPTLGIHTLKRFDDGPLPKVKKDSLTSATANLGQDVFRSVAAGTAAPFILATPHHSMAWASGATEPTAAGYEAGIAQCDAALSSIEQAKKQAQNQMKDLDAQKARLVEARAAVVKEYQGMKKTPK